MKTMSKTMLQILLVVSVLIVGGLGAKGLRSMRKLPETKPQEVRAPLLNAVRVSRQATAMIVSGYGTVEPRMTVQVVPEVAGRILTRDAQCVAGGFFDAHTALLTIDPRDYQIAVQAAEAAVAQADVQLAREAAEAQVAKREWQRIHPGKEPDSILVYREPQVNSARAQLASAQAQLEKAKLDLERTEITMPFAGRVVDFRVDVGQFVPKGQSVATVYASDVVEISVPLEDAELAWFAVPQSGQVAGAEVTVKASFAGAAHEWPGQVVRMKSRVDAKSRLVHVVVQVEDPFDVSAGRPPLLPGLFVEVIIQGKTAEDVAVVPRHAIRNGREVWVATDDQRLEVRPVTLLRQDRHFAYLHEGLKDGEVVITSPLDTVTDGMRIRTQLVD